MREIKREYTTTTYAIMEANSNQLVEVGTLVLEGNCDMAKARKKAFKEFPDRNICIGETNTETAVYTMPAEDFIKTATKTVE